MTRKTWSLSWQQVWEVSPKRIMIFKKKQKKQQKKQEQLRHRCWIWVWKPSLDRPPAVIVVCKKEWTHVVSRYTLLMNSENKVMILICDYFNLFFGLSFCVPKVRQKEIKWDGLFTALTAENGHSLSSWFLTEQGRCAWIQSQLQLRHLVLLVNTRTLCEWQVEIQTVETGRVLCVSAGVSVVRRVWVASTPPQIPLQHQQISVSTGVPHDKHYKLLVFN